jgi:hypothetical protein
MTRKYKEVEFEFLSPTEEAELLRGEVLIRDSEMLLDMACPDDTPYDIRGRATGSFYQGQHKGRPGDVPVRAKWVLLDDTYVGIWIEGGYEFLFRFRLTDSE